MSNMTIYSATITLLLVMDPLGNIPIFLSILNSVEAQRRNKIILRESIIAFLILAAFLFGGKTILQSLNVTEQALGVAGGIILFLISIKMIFPPDTESGLKERQIGEPFIVPLAIPLVAGPSALATVILIANQNSKAIWQCLFALAIASFICTLILLFASQLRKILGQKALIALERLMGMVLTTIAVEMFLNGIVNYFKLSQAS